MTEVYLAEGVWGYLAPAESLWPWRPKLYGSKDVHITLWNYRFPFLPWIQLWMFLRAMDKCRNRATMRRLHQALLWSKLNPTWPSNARPNTLGLLILHWVKMIYHGLPVLFRKLQEQEKIQASEIWKSALREQKLSAMGISQQLKKMPRKESRALDFISCQRPFQLLRSWLPLIERFLVSKISSVNILGNISHCSY